MHLTTLQEFWRVGISGGGKGIRARGCQEMSSNVRAVQGKCQTMSGVRAWPSGLEDFFCLEFSRSRNTKLGYYKQLLSQFSVLNLFFCSLHGHYMFMCLWFVFEYDKSRP